MASPDQLIIIHNDMVVFDPSSFLPATPIPPVVSGNIKAKGKSKVHKRKVCVEGDETSVKVKAGYQTAGFPIPGNGTFIIKKLDESQTTKKTKDNDKAIIIKGQKFIAELQVEKKASIPTPAGPQESPLSIHPGKGLFPKPINEDVFAG